MAGAARGKYELIFLLPVVLCLAAGAGYVRERRGQRALIDAVAKDDAPAVIRLLDDGIDPRKNRPRGAAPISLAASARALHTLNALLKRGEHAAPDDAVMPALRDDRQMVDMLLAAGADPNGHIRGLIPLMLELASNRKTDMMDHLLAAGANPNVTSKLSWNKPIGCNPLMASIMAINPEGVAVLLKAHCRLNDRIDDPASTWHGYSALMIAVKMHEVRCVRMLLKAGARQDIRSGDGKSARDIAQESGDKEIILMLANKPGITTPAQ